MAWKFPALIYYMDLRDSQKNPGIRAIFGRRWTYLASTMLLCGVWLKRAPPTMSVTRDRFCTVGASTTVRCPELRDVGYSGAVNIGLPVGTWTIVRY